ncbi:hypothetical protein BJ165DRAFT_1411400 [Panaeolus papilionaceus]|nr:hypothetical protein BJ165DRAFT_1411400 [Panaeolus papilionaceus]
MEYWSDNTQALETFDNQDEDSGGGSEEDHWEENIDRADEDDGPIDDSDNEAHTEHTEQSKKAGYEKPPTYKQISSAFDDIVNILRPPCVKTHQHYRDPKLDSVTQMRLEGMKALCSHILQLMEAEPNQKFHGIWTQASLKVAWTQSWNNPGKN